MFIINQEGHLCQIIYHIQLLYYRLKMEVAFFYQLLFVSEASIAFSLIWCLSYLLRMSSDKLFFQWRCQVFCWWQHFVILRWYEIFLPPKDPSLLLAMLYNPANFCWSSRKLISLVSWTIAIVDMFYYICQVRPTVYNIIKDMIEKMGYMVNTSL